MVPATTPHYNASKLFKRKEWIFHESPKPTFNGREPIYTTTSKKRSTMHCSRIELVSVHLNPILNGTQITKQEVLQRSPWNTFLPQSYKKLQDSSGIGRSTYLIILGKDNRQTLIFTMYRPYKGSISFMGDSTVIKQ